LNKFFDQVERAILGLAGFVDGDDARMLELGRASSLSKKSRSVLLAGEVAGAGDLDGDQPAELGIARPEDVTERSDADLLEQLESPEGSGTRCVRQPRCGPSRKATGSYSGEKRLGHGLGF
jgi:hypothetical protein